MNTQSILILIGLVVAIVILWYVWKSMKMEGFADAAAAGTEVGAVAVGGTEEIAGGPQTTNFVENISDGIFPQPSKLIFYLTAYSDQTSYGKQTYTPADQKWYNYRENVAKVNCVGEPTRNYFQAVGSAPTAKLTSAVGFPMKSVSLRGPSSYEFDTRTGQELNGFTIAVYAMINRLDLAPGVNGKIFELFVESPNFISFGISPAPPTPAVAAVGEVAAVPEIENISFVAKIGTKDYKWDFPKASIVNNSTKTQLYSLVFDKVGKKVVLRVGADDYSQTIPEADLPAIVLGTTPAEINPGMNLDFSLFAFTYFQVPLTPVEMTKLNEHFVAESTGYTRVLEKFRAEAAAAAILAAAAQEKELNQAEKLAAAQKELELCRKAAKSGVATPEEIAAWQLKIKNIEGASAADLAKCNILSLNKFGGAAATEAAVAATATTAATTTATEAAPAAPRFTVNYPWEASSANAMTGTAATAPTTDITKNPSIWTVGDAEPAIGLNQAPKPVYNPSIAAAPSVAAQRPAPAAAKKNWLESIFGA